MLSAAESEMADFTLAGAGRVRLVAFPALATLVPQALARLERSHPGVEVDLSEAEPLEAIEALRSGAADLALTFRYEHEDAAPGLVGVPLAVEAVRPLPDPAPGLGTIRELGDLREAVWAAGCPGAARTCCGSARRLGSPRASGTPLMTTSSSRPSSRRGSRSPPCRHPRRRPTPTPASKPSTCLAWAHAPSMWSLCPASPGAVLRGGHRRAGCDRLIRRVRHARKSVCSFGGAHPVVGLC